MRPPSTGRSARTRLRRPCAVRGLPPDPPGRAGTRPSSAACTASESRPRSSWPAPRPSTPGSSPTRSTARTGATTVSGTGCASPPRTTATVAAPTTGSARWRSWSSSRAPTRRWCAPTCGRPTCPRGSTCAGPASCAASPCATRPAARSAPGSIASCAPCSPSTATRGCGGAARRIAPRRPSCCSTTSRRWRCRPPSPTCGPRSWPTCAPGTPGAPPSCWSARWRRRSPSRRAGSASSSC